MAPSLTVALDFDGVLHHNQSPWTRIGEVNDAPVEGAREFVWLLRSAGMKCVVHTCRAHHGSGSDAVAQWLRDWGFPDMRVTAVKPHAVYLDDKALRFDGVWPSVAVLEAAGVTWNRRAA